MFPYIVLNIYNTTQMLITFPVSSSVKVVIHILASGRAKK